MAMLVNATEFKTRVGKYLELVDKDITIKAIREERMPKK